MTMTREERIRKTWQMYAKHAERYVRAGMFEAYIYFDTPELCPVTPETIPTIATMDRVTFTFEAVGWQQRGEYWEWWNVLCEGRIIAYIPYDSPHRENQL